MPPDTNQPQIKGWIRYYYYFLLTPHPTLSWHGIIVLAAAAAVTRMNR